MEKGKAKLGRVEGRIGEGSRKGNKEVGEESKEAKMQVSGRDARSGNNSQSSMNKGFPLHDPFAGFPSFSSDMFENDPFFTRPFGRPFGSGQSLFGSAGGLFGAGGFFNEPGSGQEQQSSLDRGSYHAQADGSRRGVHIEEVPDDHDFVGKGQHISNQEPIVEHPDDGDAVRNRPIYNSHRTNTQSRSGPSRSSSNPVKAYSFQSSSVMYGGANGPYYAAQTTRRQGPDGVIEEEHQEKNTSSGKETHRISHGLHDKGRTFTRERNAEGQEEQFETLHNLGDDESQDFERRWETLAEKNLPQWNRSSSQRLGSSSKSHPALPSSGNSASKGQ